MENISWTKTRKSFDTAGKEKLISVSEPSPRAVPSYMPPGLKSIIIKSFIFGSWLREHPYFWDKKEDRMKQRTGKWNRFFWYSTQAVTYLTFAFVAMRAFQTFRSDTATGGTKLLCVFLTVFLTFPILFQLTLLKYRDELIELLNSAFVLYKDFDRTLTGTPHNHQGWILEVWITEQFLRCLYYTFFCLWFMNMPVVILKPNLPVLITSLVDPSSNYYPAALAASTIVMSCYASVYVFTGFVMIFVGSGVAFPLVAVIKALGTRTMKTRAECKTNIRRYNEIRILLNRLDEAIYSFLFPYGQDILIILSTFSLVGAIKFSGIISLLLTSVGLVAYVILCVICYGAASIQSQGSLLLGKWKHDPAIDQRNIRCLRPIRGILGPYGYIDKALILTATNIIADNSITLLLA